MEHGFRINQLDNAGEGISLLWVEDIIGTKYH
jgi:hypothetical protein